jgi:DNA-binding NarL/FixJ family response regulator
MSSLGSLGSPDSAPSVVRVLIVDDHEVLASSLAQVLDTEPDLKSVGVAGSLERAKAMIPTVAPDVLLLDHRLPDGDGVAAIGELRALRRSMRIVVLTASGADHVLLAAMEAGAVGFLSKSRGLEEVTAAIRAAVAGESVISPELLARLLPKLNRSGAAHRDELTEREREVLALVAAGLTNAAIAERLHLSVHTVRNHVTNLSLKLGAHSKLEALSIAVREGLLPGH